MQAAGKCMVSSSKYNTELSCRPGPLAARDPEVGWVHAVLQLKRGFRNNSWIWDLTATFPQ